MGDIPPTGQLPVWRAGRPPSNSNRTANPTQPRDPQSVLVHQQFGRQNQHSGPQAYQSAPSPGRANIPINSFPQGISFRDGHPNPGPRGRANMRGRTSVFNPRFSGAAFRADSQNPQYSAFSSTQSRNNVPSPPRYARQSNPASPRVPQGPPPRHPQTGQAPRINNPLVTSTSPFQQRTSHTTPSSRQHGHVTRLTPTTPMKTTGPVKPRWQSEDEAYEAIRGSKRTRDDSGGNRRISALDSVRRVSSISAVSRRRAFNVNPQANENRPKTHVLPVFKVRVEGQPAPESDEDDDLDVPVRRPQKRVGLGHTGTAEGSREGPRMQTGHKSIRSTSKATKTIGMRPSETFAARKVGTQPASQDENDTTSSSDSDSSTGSQGSEKHPSDEEGTARIAPGPDVQEDGEGPEEDTDADAVVSDDAEEESPDFDYGPSLDLHRELTRALTPDPSPPHELLVATKEPLLSLIRMKQTKQLPFLRRSIRRGFRLECKRHGISVDPSGEIAPGSPEPGVSVLIRYTCFTNGILSQVYETVMNHWLCPLCQLHGPFKNRDMLSAHLIWDHREFICRWEPSDRSMQYLSVQISTTITEDGEESVIALPTPRKLSETPVQTPVPSTTVPPELTPARTPFPDPFPHVEFSPTIPNPPPTTISGSPTPASTTPVTGRSETPAIPKSPEIPKIPKIKLQEPRAKSPSVSVAPSSRTYAISARESSTTTTTTTTTTRASMPSTTSTIISANYANPLAEFNLPLPPQSTPYGPAAQPPYLPAYSLYDGPTVHYSCRPSGPCLYDLLNTLPLTAYGVLAWAVVDREEEIFESNDVADELKVMHALWARWITLNRKEFIASYRDGTKGFISYYWKMIHLAAGWAALRAWLLMLLGNRFLTGNDVAELLKHYEKQTKMDRWYE